MIQARDLARRYGARVALSRCSFDLGKGQILGLAGPNGSGKTTLLKILAGMLRPSAGEAQVFGLNPYQQRVELMRRARFVFAPPALYPRLSAREHLQLLGALGQDHRPSAQEVDRVLEMVGLRDRARDRTATFSFGMRQRLILAQALLPMPELLVFDEPTSGLDPLAVLELRQVLADLREQHGVSILLSSHLLLELDELVDQLLVLDQGELIFTGPPSALHTQEPAAVLRVNDAVGVKDYFAAKGVRSELEGEQLLVRQALDLEATRSMLREAGFALLEYSQHRPNLEQALLDRLRDRRQSAERAS